MTCALTSLCLGDLVYGVVSGEGPEWYEQRKFMLKTLTDLGMGKKDFMQDIISEEVEQTVQILRSREGTRIKAKVGVMPLLFDLAL